MKKSIVTFLLSLATVTTCFSKTICHDDSLICITPQELKQTNLIFLEHKKLKLEVEEYKMQIKNYSELVNTYKESEKINQESIVLLEDHIEESHAVISEQMNEIEDLNRNRKLYKGLTIGGFTISLVLLTLLFIK